MAAKRRDAGCLTFAMTWVAVGALGATIPSGPARSSRQIVSAVSGPVDDRVSMKLDLTEVVSVGEPVILRYQVSNHSTALANVDFGWGNRGKVFAFTLVYPDERVVSVRPELPDRSLMRVGPRLYQSRSLILDRWFAFTEPGRYRLAVVFDGRLRSGQAADFVRDATFGITVLPHSPGRLRARCEELIERLERGDLLEGPRELAYVKDPIAVPYLRRAIESVVGDYELMMNSLVEIGTPEAGEALRALAGNPRPFVAKAAADALARWGRGRGSQSLRVDP